MIAVTADCGELGGLRRGREGLAEVGLADDAVDFRFLSSIELDIGGISLKDFPLRVDSVFIIEPLHVFCGIINHFLAQVAAVDVYSLEPRFLENGASTAKRVPEAAKFCIAR